MLDFVQNTLDGVMLGSSYSLLALGFTLIFGAMRRLNLSFGPSLMVGAFAGTWVYMEWRAGGLAVAGATLAGAVIATVYVERICFRAIRREAVLASMISSFAIWMQLEEAGTILFPRPTYPFPALSGADPVFVGDLMVRPEHLVMFLTALGRTGRRSPAAR
jgi:branched-chain amino acid transport system permease protein